MVCFSSKLRIDLLNSKGIRPRSPVNRFLAICEKGKLVLVSTNVILNYIDVILNKSVLQWNIGVKQRRPLILL